LLCYFRKVLQDVLKIENNNELHLLDEEKLNELKDALQGFTTTRGELFHLAKNESEKKNEQNDNTNKKVSSVTFRTNIYRKEIKSFIRVCWEKLPQSAVCSRPGEYRCTTGDYMDVILLFSASLASFLCKDRTEVLINGERIKLVSRDCK